MALYFHTPRSSYNPFSELREAMRSFQDHPAFQISRNLDSAFSTSARPALDWHETDKAFEVHADVPGIAKEDLKLSFSEDGSTLTLSGEVKRNWASASSDASKANEQKQVESDAQSQPAPPTESQNVSQPSYVERFHGTFSRSVRFPSLIDAEKTTASLKDGVLSVTVPKREAKGVKSIEIA